MGETSSEAIRKFQFFGHFHEGMTLRLQFSVRGGLMSVRLGDCSWTRLIMSRLVSRWFLPSVRQRSLQRSLTRCRLAAFNFRFHCCAGLVTYAAWPGSGKCP